MTTSKTGQLQEKKRKPGTFVKGDKRINRKGRPPIPKDQAELNALIDEILFEEIEDGKGNKMQKVRVLLNKLIMSRNSAGQIHILDRRYGKVPQKLEGPGEGGEHIVRVIEIVKKPEEDE